MKRIFVFALVTCTLAASYAEPEKESEYMPSAIQSRAEIKWVRPICVQTNRYIGWPSVCRLKNGDIIAVFSGDRKRHVCPYGKVQMIRSSDEGDTWTAPVTIADGPIDDRDAGIVQLPDGEILVTYFTSVAYRNAELLKNFPDYKKVDSKLTDADRKNALGNFAIRSRDNGKTWSKPEKLKLVGQTPHGPVLLKDGSLFQIGRTFTNSPVGGSEDGYTVISAERSTDGGRTWKMLCRSIPDMNGENSQKHMFHEPHAVELSDGTLVGLVRYHGTDNCMRQTVSKDGGRTWSPMAKTGMVGLPPHLIRLADGKLVNVYGRRIRSVGFGEFAAISDDGGKSWDVENEIVLAKSHNGDLGYPASCVLANGDILTVYYQQPNPGTKPCLMATRWRIRDGKRNDCPEFSDVSRWFATNYENRLTFDMRGQSLKFTNAYTNKRDNAWRIDSPMVSVPVGTASYAVRYEGRSDETYYGVVSPKVSWEARVTWYDARKKEIETAPFLAFVPYGDFSEIEIVGSVPKGAAYGRFRVGQDFPDLNVGSSIEFRKFAISFSCGSVEKPWGRVVKRGKTSDYSGIGRDVRKKAAAFPKDRMKGIQKATLRDDGFIQLDGEPYFPIGIFGVMEREFNGQSYDTAFRYLAKAGFDFAHTYRNAYDGKFFAAAHKHGFKLWVAFRSPDGRFLNEGRFSPAILTWYLGDDTATWWTPETIYRRNFECKASDPFRLSCQADFMSSFNPYSRYVDYIHATDIFMPEIYSIRWDTEDLPKDHDTDRSYVALTIRDMKRVKSDLAKYGNGEVKCCLPILQAFKGWTKWRRFPNRTELLATTFASIIHGAHGVVYYTYGGMYRAKDDQFNQGITSSEERWNTVSEVCNWVKELKPALVARKGRQPRVDIFDGPKKDIYGNQSVTCLLKRVGGKAYLMAVNATDKSVRVLFHIGDVGSRATVMRENRELRCVEGLLIDDFAPFAVHVYELDSLSDN